MIPFLLIMNQSEIAAAYIRHALHSHPTTHTHRDLLSLMGGTQVHMQKCICHGHRLMCHGRRLRMADTVNRTLNQGPKARSGPDAAVYRLYDRVRIT